MLDTELNVHVDVLSTGRYPGDDKPKPIQFPDQLDPWVRDKFLELWQAVDAAGANDPF